MIQFQYFSNNVQEAKPIGFVSLDRFIKSIRKPQNAEVFEAISIAEANNDKELKAQLKKDNLYYFTPCVHLENGRKYTDIKSWTGILVLDFDGIDNAQELKQHLFEDFNFVISVWISPSKRGVKAFVKIPICTSTDEFKRRFKAIDSIFGAYDGFDSTAKNCVLPLFQSIDSEVLYRNDAVDFTEEQDTTEYNHAPVEKIHVNTTSFDSLRAVALIKSSVDKISGEGHPQLRGASIFAGGLVASGYISQHDCEQLLENLIRTNQYLSKGISGYLATSKWGIKQGMNKQIILENNESK